MSVLRLCIAHHTVFVDRDKGMNQRFDNPIPLKSRFGQLRRLEPFGLDQLHGLDHAQRPRCRCHSAHSGSKTIAGSIPSSSSGESPPCSAICPSS